ncbi:MAG: pilin [Patescibacteria group bacterium]
MKVLKYLKLGLALGFFLSLPIQALANCMWVLNNECSEIGKTNAWSLSDNSANCQATVKPSGTTVKCCCAAEVAGCCEKTDKQNNVTTEDLTGEKCKSITYAATVFYQDFKAQNNRCVPKNSLGNCVWRSFGSCNNGEVKEESNNCPGERPAAKIMNGEAIEPSCCCTKTATTPPTVTPSTPPKFTMPELQIAIPGLTLTPSSSIKYTANQDGSYQVEIPWLSEYILAIYNYGLSIAGILAAITLMAGGVLWLISGGDASKTTRAKELIAGSVTGLVILFSSYLILFEINPDLVQLKSISIGSIKEVDLEPLSNDGNPNNTKDCENCVILDNNIPYKNGNKLNTALNDKLKSAWAGSNGVAWRVTEAYPPSSTHRSACHYNGACVDVGLTGDKSCANVNKLITILQNAGLRVLNEYTDCNGTKTTYTTGGHIHVY